MNPCPKCRGMFIGILPNDRFECINCGIIWRQWAYACREEQKVNDTRNL